MKFAALSKRSLIWVGVALSVVAALIAYITISSSLHQTLRWQDDEYLHVSKGQSFNSLCQTLIKRSVVADCFGHKVLGRLGLQQLSIKSGTYEIDSTASLQALVDKLVEGNEVQLPITIVEGENIYQVLEKLARARGINNDLQGLSLTEIADKLSIEQSHPEGYLFPETYHYTFGTSASELLKRAVVKQKTMIDSIWQAAEDKQGLKNSYEMLILASIIEKESSLHAERDLIASVFFNRIARKMRLQTDPTVIYGVWEEYKGDITRAHLRQKTPYNTYRINGLPPSPIANPSEASMRAVMNPAQSDYLYFVASGDGNHVFSKTLEQHNKALKAYLKKMRSS